MYVGKIGMTREAHKKEKKVGIRDACRVRLALVKSNLGAARVIFRCVESRPVTVGIRAWMVDAW